MRPYSTHFQQHYWSTAGGEAEKTHVFLQGNQLPRRCKGARQFVVGELGFGTGLSCLLTWQLWQQQAAPGAVLTYVGYELHPLPATALQSIHTSFSPALQPLAAALQQHYAPQPGWNTWHLAGVCPLQLHLFVGDALTGLATHPTPTQAWFLDGFSPAHNPALWSLPLCQRVAAHTAPNGTLATYSVAAQVRQNLTETGWQVTRQPGLPPKRHCLNATR